MARKRRTDETLRAASDHLYYEYWMFRSLTEALSNRNAQPEWLRNALVESWVVHLRALLDFVYPPQSVNPDDVVAADFFDDLTKWESDRPAISGPLSRGRQRANKEIAHLSYKRIGISDGDKQWHVVALAQEIDALIGTFLRLVQKSRLGPRWPKNMVSVA